MQYQVTVRYGTLRVSYHMDRVEGANLAEAMRTAAERLPPEVVEAGELVEIRPAVDPGEREYLDGEPGGSAGTPPDSVPANDPNA